MSGRRPPLRTIDGGRRSWREDDDARDGRRPDERWGEGPLRRQRLDVAPSVPRAPEDHGAWLLRGALRVLLGTFLLGFALGMVVGRLSA